MTISFDGMSSGLNTTEIVESLIAIQANQQVLLQQRSADASDLVAALQSLNAKVASLADAATNVANPASWDVAKVWSSAGSVTATVADGAQPGSIEFSVEQLASGQVSMIDPMSLEPTLTIAVGGNNFQVTPSSSHVDDVAAAVNARQAETGIGATTVKVGTDAGGNAVYNLQLTGESGAGQAFRVYAGTDTTVAPIASADNALAPARDAIITMWPASGAGYELTSSTNTFGDVLAGVGFSVSEVAPDPVTLTVSTDAEAQEELVAGLVTNVAVVLGEIISRTKTTTSTGSDGSTVASGGLFSGDSAIRFLQSDVQAAVTGAIDGRSPSTIGIEIDRHGEITFDSGKFTAAMAADSAGTMAMVQTVAGRVAEVAQAASAPTSGTLSRKITSHESLISDLQDQITRWDDRLEMRRQQLYSQFTSMEVRLAQLQSTSNWLSSQLASLPGLNASKE